MKMAGSFLAAGLAAFLCSMTHAGELKLAPFHGDKMVVQRGRPIVLLGVAEAGAKVSAEFAGDKAEAVADAKGIFTLKLPARKADKEGRMLTVRSGGQTIALKDVLVGDVWLCAGQSNMEFNMHRLGIADEAKGEDRPLIRRIKVAPAFLPAPADPMRVAMDGGWQAGTPETIANWTATGYYFARTIQDRNPELPIGLYDCGYSGSPIEPWIPMETWADFPMFKEGANAGNRLKLLCDREAWRMPSGIYNGMVQSLTVTPIAGAIWYQGEGNAGQPDYAVKMQAMVSGWRKAWGIDFPFYYVQLAGYMGPHDDPALRPEWAFTRDLQLQTLLLIPKSGMASAYDIGDVHDIHPKNKFDVGERLARWALRDVYGDRSIVVSGPLFKQMEIEGDKVRIRFDYAESGLIVGKKEGKAPVKEIQGGKPGGFVVGNREGKWAWADAVIDGATVVVSSPKISQPVAVRYAFTNSPGGANLYNKAGLPASPFAAEPPPAILQSAVVQAPAVQTAVESEAPKAAIDTAAKTAVKAAPQTPEWIAAAEKAKATQARPEGWEMGPFVKHPEPVLRPNPDSVFRCPIMGKEVRWEEMNTYNPAAIVKDGKMHLLYRADGQNPECGWGRVCRIGLAVSEDGIHFKCHPQPVVYPDNDEFKKYEWAGGCEDLHVVEDEAGTYYMNYTTHTSRHADKYQDTMSIATSRDLIHWTKHGPALQKYNPEKVNGSRSGVVVSRRVGDKLIAAKVDGKYWMFYTHGCVLAWSDDLINWHWAGKVGWPRGTEAGAIALLRDDGILLMGQTGAGPLGGWCLWQQLHDRADLSTKPLPNNGILKEQKDPFLWPEHEWEIKGMTGYTTVSNALTPFKGKWFLYYGAADTYTGVATCPIAEGR